MRAHNFGAAAIIRREGTRKHRGELLVAGRRIGGRRLDFTGVRSFTLIELADGSPFRICRLRLAQFSANFIDAETNEVPKVAPKTRLWDKLVNVTYKPQKFDDVDLFHCILQDGNELILRLYFADAPEEEKVYADRIKDRAAYFGVSEAYVIKVGHESSAFTKRLLEKPFTVWTRWHKALGRSKHHRGYCSIVTHDGKDLAKELVRNGYARIYGTKTVTYDGKTSKQFNAELEALEAEAKKEKRRGWGIGK